jgi:hypothetical protein
MDFKYLTTNEITAVLRALYMDDNFILKFIIDDLFRANWLEDYYNYEKFSEEVSRRQKLAVVIGDLNNGIGG